MFTDYLTGILSILVGVIQLWKVRKLHKVIYLTGAYFILVGIVDLADALSPSWNLSGTPGGIALRLLTIAMLVVLLVVFYKEQRAPKGNKQDGPGNQDGPGDA